MTAETIHIRWRRIQLIEGQTGRRVAQADQGLPTNCCHGNSLEESLHSIGTGCEQCQTMVAEECYSNSTQIGDGE